MLCKGLSYTYKIIHIICRLLLCCTFVFSGFVKVADPMGMTHKLHAYTAAVGLQFSDNSLLLEFVATALGSIEFVLGVYLFLGAHRRFTTRVITLLMTGFTLITIWIYVKDPVADCGCFGDAITLTNAQTLVKNVLLLAAALVVQFLRIPHQRLVTARNTWVISIYAWIYAIGLALYSLHYLPILDFSAYTPGVNIRAALMGEVDNPKSKKLANFYLADARTGDDRTLDIVADTGYTFLLTVPSTITADDGCCDRINDLYDYCHDHHYAFYMATSSTGKDVANWIDRTGAAYPILMAEDTELSTMVRSTPGLMLLHNGFVVNKWSNNNLPEVDNVETDIKQWGVTPSYHHPLTTLVLWFVIPLCIIVLLDSMWIGHKFYKHHIYVKRFKLKKIMRKKIVAGNWKMNKNLQEGVALAKELNEVLTADKPNCGVIICTPFIHLASVANIIDSNIIGLGAENCANKVSGAYTGEVSAEMVKSTGANYVILGHSERRAYYHETPEILKEKVNLALANNLDVIFCIGEVLEDREAGKQNEIVKAQLEGSLFDLTAEQFSHIILAYEPVWAIGTGKTATADQAEEMHAFIRQTIADKFGAEAAENVSILYGGSCKPSNAKEIFSKVNVDGGLIGGAALKAADFKGIIDAWKA